MKSILTAACLLISLVANSATVTIGVFNELKVSALVLSVESGKYSVFMDGVKRMSADENAVYQLVLENDSIRIKTMDKNYGKFKRIEFNGNDTGALKLKCINPSKPAKRYDNDFLFFVEANQIKLRNKVDLEKYLAGVVEVEAGPSLTPEYYKVQAIICRTYALSNMRRHETENFNLCDNVHCQAYKGFNNLNPAIETAAFATKNLVLVDSKSELITTAFHSNCGGETCNSEDVWGMPRPYLRSVQDTFCLRQRNAKWTKKVAKQEWNSYLAQNCKPCATDTSALCCDFNQEHRSLFIEIDSTKILLKNIRNDLKLKSAFFSIQLQPDSLLFVGKGYGHGVGLCQEGAIQMAKQGLSYSRILHFYYKDVDIINLSRLHFFKE
ncbi:MAG: SpoIID/LytB domain-containing protein [Bacteroidetes bacterium]|nr:SpoIID/LytB domain-containing protein [Bacteroidota bacterium]